MALPREFVAYLAKQVLKRLVDAKLIEYEQPEYVLEVITQVMLDEVLIEDKINEEVRRILEELFKKVKKQIVRERQVIL